MPEVLTLAGLTVAALTEGIKFLYAQASELLHRRRDRNTESQEAAPPRHLPEIVAEPATLPAPDDAVVEGSPPICSR